MDLVGGLGSVPRLPSPSIRLVKVIDLAREYMGMVVSSFCTSLILP